MFEPESNAGKLYQNANKKLIDKDKSDNNDIENGDDDG